MTDPTTNLNQAEPPPVAPMVGSPSRRLRYAQADHVARINSLSAYGTVSISLIVVTGFFGVMFFLLVKPLGELSDTMNAIMNILLGALVAKFGSAVDYWLGSSASSARKDAAHDAPLVPPVAAKPIGG